jgi:hypothetical protein
MDHAWGQALKKVMGGTSPVGESQHRSQPDCIGRKGTSKPFSEPRAQDQLWPSVGKRTAPVILDVRSKSEYASRHVPEVLYMPFYPILCLYEEIKPTPEDLIILYCE